MSGCVALRRSSTGGVVTWLVTRFIGPPTSSLATPAAVLSSNAHGSGSASFTMRCRRPHTPGGYGGLLNRLDCGVPRSRQPLPPLHRLIAGRREAVENRPRQRASR